jgi:hypothetical protein
MTRLEWDLQGQRTYAAGVDHGVLYLPDETGAFNYGVAWNGLTAIDEDFGDNSFYPGYWDGVKYRNGYQNGRFAINLEAFTYPDEFLEIEGLGYFDQGMFVDDQRPKVFGLSYRTYVGDDISGVDLGYQIHLLYNLMTVRESFETATYAETLDPILFTWTIASVPERAAEGYQSTAHVILDSRFLDPAILHRLEDIIYGNSWNTDILDGLYSDSIATDVVDGGTPYSSGEPIIDGNTISIQEESPRLPSLVELMDLVWFLSGLEILPDTTNGLSDLVPGGGDLTATTIPGILTVLPGTSLIETSVPGLYQIN